MAGKNAGPRRSIGAYGGVEPGPIVVCVCGIHGNEPAGLRAAERVLEALHRRQPRLRGEFIAIAGNLEALARGRRYLGKDLNRQWTPERIRTLETATRPEDLEPEDREQLEMWRSLESVLSRSDRPVTFLDLHTSSADGPPFATMGDTLLNRRFVQRLPVPVILGLEEQIDGALLEFVNNLGHVTVGVEAGRHDRQSSIERHEAVLWLSLLAAGSLDAGDVPEAPACRETLRRAAAGLPGITEVRHRHALREGDGFEMNPGYENFQPIRKGEVLARDRRGPIRALEAGVILLPLYQPLGDDGFFIGRAVRPFWLKVSAALRRLGAPSWPHLLPGVRRHPAREDTLIVDTRIARFYPLDLFHLLGYRKRRWQGNILLVTRRREGFYPGAAS